jgi:hypothetical protein
MTDGNGHIDGTVYVRFGPKETQEIHLETAQEMLTKWRERQPVQFGRMLAEVLTGVPPKGR